VTAIAGKSGAGKSTVINLLLKLYAPTSGAILVGDADLGAIDTSAWLRSVRIAGQDIDLLEGSLLDNLRLAEPDLSEADAMASLDFAGIGDFVRGLPEGLGTFVGERGLRLSGGQRQRIVLARALAGRPEVLILDEATNAVDPALETEILTTIRSRAELTIIVVAHREGVAELADAVITLDRGEVVGD
jgi:ABC-type multidrug transport system fused ATPase/permease subunit